MWSFLISTDYNETLFPLQNTPNTKIKAKSFKKKGTEVPFMIKDQRTNVMQEYVKLVLGKYHPHFLTMGGSLQKFYYIGWHHHKILLKF